MLLENFDKSIESHEMALSDSTKILVNIVDPLRRLMMRWRHPFCLPEEVLSVLGLESPSLTLSFDELMHFLSSAECQPQNLMRYMSRVDAEAVFSEALKKERFNNETLFSFYFAESWVEFILHFDSESKLRRVYLQYNGLDDDEGIEINLPRKPQTKKKIPVNY